MSLLHPSYTAHKFYLHHISICEEHFIRQKLISLVIHKFHNFFAGNIDRIVLNSILFMVDLNLLSADSVSIFMNWSSFKPRNIRSIYLSYVCIHSISQIVISMLFTAAARDEKRKKLLMINNKLHTVWNELIICLLENAEVGRSIFGSKSRSVTNK